MTPDHPSIARRHLLGGAAAVAAGAPLLAAASHPAHATDTTPRRSHLELDPKNYVELDADFLGTQQAHYPRIKTMANGRHLLTYQASQHSWNVHWSTSDDLLHWEQPQKLFASHKILDGADDRCYATADACVLDNGEILAVCSFRANKLFSARMDLDGLMLRRSTDHGRSWQAEQVIYVGANWEPTVHQTSAGEVQVYFTHSAPKRVLENTKGSTGVAIIRSYDRGRSWAPDVRDFPYAADRVAQQYVRTNDDGVQMFTDQMPSVLQTGGPGQIALAMESHLADGYWISLAHTQRNWPDKLEMNETGPTDRTDNMFPGAAPYLAQFSTGETVLAYNYQSAQYLRLGNSQARNFAEPESFLPGNGYWGSVEVVPGDRLAATMHHSRSDGNGIMIGVLDLVRPGRR